MTASRPFEVRPAGPDDAEAVAGLRLVVTPYQVFTAGALRHAWTSAPPQAHQLLLVAEMDGEIVGFVRALFDLTTSVAGTASVFVMVRPDSREQGIGGRLYATAEAHLRAAGASVIVGRGSGDFAVHR